MNYCPHFNYQSFSLSVQKDLLNSGWSPGTKLNVFVFLCLINHHFHCFYLVHLIYCPRREWVKSACKRSQQIEQVEQNRVTLTEWMEWAARVIERSKLPSGLFKTHFSLTRNMPLTCCSNFVGLLQFILSQKRRSWYKQMTELIRMLC